VSFARIIAAVWRMVCSVALIPRAAVSMAWAAGRSQPSMSWLIWS